MSSLHGKKPKHLTVTENTVDSGSSKPVPKFARKGGAAPDGQRPSGETPAKRLSRPEASGPDISDNTGGVRAGSIEPGAQAGGPSVSGSPSGMGGVMSRPGGTGSHTAGSPKSRAPGRSGRSEPFGSGQGQAEPDDVPDIEDEEQGAGEEFDEAADGASDQVPDAGDEQEDVSDGSDGEAGQGQESPEDREEDRDKMTGEDSDSDSDSDSGSGPGSKAGEEDETDSPDKKKRDGPGEDDDESKKKGEKDKAEEKDGPDKKDQGKAITSNDKKAADDTGLPSKKDKKNGPVEKVKKAVRAAQTALKLLKAAVMMKTMLMVAQAVAAVMNALAVILNAVVTVVQTVVMVMAMIGTVLTLGVVGFILVAAVLIGAIVGTADDTATKDSMPCVERADWDSLELDYLDIGDTNEAQSRCARIIYGVFRQLGYDNSNIAGILANFTAESGVDPTKLENNVNNGSWSGGSWAYSNIYEHANEDGMPQYHAEYGVLDGCPDGTMGVTRYLFSQSLYQALGSNADIGSASSRFSVTMNKGTSAGGYAQDFVNVNGVSFNRPSKIEESLGFEDIRNTVAGKTVDSVVTSGVGKAGSNTFNLTGTVTNYDSEGRGSSSTQTLSHAMSMNVGPEVGSASQKGSWGASYPAHITGKDYKSDWMYCAGGAVLLAHGNYTVAERFDPSAVKYNNLYESGEGEAAGAEGDTFDDVNTDGVTVSYTHANGTVETFPLADWQAWVVDNIAWGYCDEHQCSGIHQFKANAPSTYQNPTWCYWCVECWYASWINTSDYWVRSIDGDYNVPIEEHVGHTCRHAVTASGTDVATATPSVAGHGTGYDYYLASGYSSRTQPNGNNLGQKTEMDQVDGARIAEYNKVVVGSDGTGSGPHRVHIPHLSDFHIWATDDVSVYQYWKGDTGVAATGGINMRGAGLGQFTNDRFKGGSRQNLHTQLSSTGFRGASSVSAEAKPVMNNRTENIGGTTVSQPSWVNEALKNAGLYNYARSRGMDWYEIEAQLQYMLDAEEGDGKAEWLQIWATGREPDAVVAAKKFFVIWEMCMINDSEGWEEAVASAKPESIESHSNTALAWQQRETAWLSSMHYSRSMSESIVQAAKAASDRGIDRADEVGYCDTASHANTDIAHAAALLGWGEHDKANSTPGTQLFVCVRNNVFDPSESHYHSNKGHYPAQKYVYQSCDISVATAVRWAGADDTYPGYACKQQMQYLMAHKDKWQQVAVGSFEPGDVLINPQHTRIYVSEPVILEVRPELAGNAYEFYEGSLNTHSPWFSKASPSYDNTFYVFRNIHEESGSKWKDITICDKASMTVPGVAHSQTG